jgi:hypothetical protein
VVGRKPDCYLVSTCGGSRVNFEDIETEIQFDQNGQRVLELNQL